MTKDIEAIRAGLYGHGPFAMLEKHILSMEPLVIPRMKATLRPPATSEMEHAPLVHGCSVESRHRRIRTKPMRYRSGFKYFGGLFGGTFSTPNLLQDEGIATPEYPSDHTKFGRSTTSQAQSNMDQVKSFGALAQESR